MTHGAFAVRRAGRILLLFITILAWAFAGTTSADAAVRYAAPGGVASGTCPLATPCGIEFAIEGAGNGDEVIVQPGVLTANAEITATASNLVIHGVSAGAKPQIASTSSTSALNVTGTSTVVRNLGLSHFGSGGLSAALLLNGTSGERLEVTSDATFGCALSNGAVLRDSVCRTSKSNAGAIGVISFTPTTVYARNVTAVATGAASSSGILVFAPSTANVELDARNVVAKGLPDINNVASSSGIATATMSYSDYATTTPVNGPTSFITPAGTGTNITALPLFADAPLGDFHQLAASPTRNTGATDARTGTTDFEGELRPQGTIDIGADEFTEPVAPPPAADTTPPATSIDKKPAKKTKSKKASFSFSADEAATFRCKLDKGSFTACTSPTKLKNLKKAKHTFTVVATDEAGNVDTSPATYRWKIKAKRKH